MKIAVLTVGQFRTADSKVVQETSKYHLYEKYNPDIYSVCWNNRGLSQYSIETNFCPHNPNEIIIEKNITDIYGKYLKDYKILNYDSFIKESNPKYFSSKNYYQYFYQIFVGKNMIDINKYDQIILTRHDFYYWNSIPSCVFSPGVCWHQNINESYFPNRVYDVWLSIDTNIFQTICNVYKNIDDYLNSNDTTCSLSKDDTCRILYLAIKNKYKIETTSYCFGDVYRNFPLDKKLEECNIGNI